jgi:hypothetical protein
MTTMDWVWMWAAAGANDSTATIEVDWGAAGPTIGAHVAVSRFAGEVADSYLSEWALTNGEEIPITAGSEPSILGPIEQTKSIRFDLRVSQETTDTATALIIVF